MEEIIVHSSAIVPRIYYPLGYFYVFVLLIRIAAILFKSLRDKAGIKTCLTEIVPPLGIIIYLMIPLIGLDSIIGIASQPTISETFVDVLGGLMVLYLVILFLLTCAYTIRAGRQVGLCFKNRQLYRGAACILLWSPAGLWLLITVFVLAPGFFRWLF